MALVGTALSLVVLVVLVFADRPEMTVPVAAAPVPIAASRRPVQPVSASPIRALPNPVTSLDFGRAGAAAYAQGDFDAALEKFEQAVQKSPNDPRALNNLGQALVRVQRPKDAVPHFLRAVELNPAEWELRFNLANAYGVLGQWNRAIAEYEKAAELFPDDYVTQYNLGLALHRAGQEEAAIAAFQRAVALAPEEPSFHLSLAISYEQLNRRKEAAEAYQAYLKMTPSSPDAEKIRSRIEALQTPASN
jgi:Flp pilus assembly protein TadD